MPLPNLYASGSAIPASQSAYYNPQAIAARRAAMEANQAPRQSLAAHVRNPAYQPWLQQQQQKYQSMNGNPMQQASWISDGRNYNAVAGLTSAGTLDPGAAWRADLMMHGGGPNTQGPQGPMTGTPSRPQGLQGMYGGGQGGMMQALPYFGGRSPTAGQPSPYGNPMQQQQMMGNMAQQMMRPQGLQSMYNQGGGGMMQQPGRMGIMPMQGNQQGGPNVYY